MDNDILELYDLLKKSNPVTFDVQSKCNKIIYELVDVFNESVELHKNIEDRKKKIKEEFDEMIKKIIEDKKKRDNDINDTDNKDNNSNNNQNQSENNDNKANNENKEDKNQQSEEIKDEPEKYEKPPNEKLDILINKLFRFIALYCHPDKANTEEKKEISKLFVPANKAKKTKKIINLFLIYQQVIDKGFTQQIPQWSEDDYNIIKYELNIYRKEIEELRDTCLGRWNELSDEMKSHYFDEMLKVNGIKK
jgi:chemotaxis protein histidine kinase CheA